MAERSRIRPAEYIEIDATSKELFRSPLYVIRQTRDNLNLLLSDQVEPKPIVDYLKDFTVPFLDEAKSAIPYKYPTQSSNISSIDNDVDTDQISSLNITQVILNSMPDFLRNEYFPDGHSRKGIVRPPATANQLELRISEMKTTLNKINKYQNRSNILIYSSPSVFRTIAFFHVGAELPYKTDTTDTDEMKIHNYFYGDPIKEENKARLERSVKREEKEKTEREDFKRKTDKLLEALLDNIDFSV